MLVLDPSLEAVLAIDLGEVIRNLKGLAHFVGRQEGIAAQLCKISDSEGRETAIFLPLLDALYAKLRRNPIRSAFRSEARRVQMGEPAADLIDSLGREKMSPCCIGLT